MLGISLPVLFYSLLFTLFISCGTLVAAEQNDSASTDIAFEYELDEIVVEEQGPAENAQIGDVLLEYDTSFHTVITPDQFEGRITDVATIIAQHSPVQVRDSGGLGSFSTISLRGSSGARLPIYVDGMLMNNNDTGIVDFSSLSTGQIEQIEVYRGIVPMAFSQASIGGAINIRTRRLREPSANISYGIGSFNTHKLEGNFTNNRNNWRYSISGSHQQSKNNYSYKFNQGTVYNSSDDYITERNHNGFVQNNIHLKVESPLSDVNRFILSINGSEQSNQLPAWNNFHNPETKLDKSTTSLSLKWISRFNSKINSASTFGFQRTKLIYSDRLSSLGVGAQFAEYITEKGFANLYLEYFLNNNIVSVNSEISHEKYSPTYFIGTRDYADSARTTFSTGLQSQSFFFSNKLIIVPALRIQQYSTSRSKSALYDELNSEDLDYGLQLGLLWQVNSNLKLKNNWSRYIRIPTFIEQYSDAGLSKGNPDLLPEIGRSVDLGFESNIPTPSFIHKITFSGSIYQTYIDNVITWIYPQGVGLATNISKSKMQGVEIQLAIDFSKKFSFNSMMNVNDSRIIEGPYLSSNKRIPGQAFISTMNYFLLNFKQNYQIKLEANAEIGKYYDLSNKFPIKNQYRINTTFTWQNRNLRSDISFNNMLNQLSEDYYLNPLPGRSLYLTFRYKF